MHAPSITTLPVSSFSVPERLSGLVRLAYNFYWSWHPEVQDLFKRINPILWAQEVGPVQVLAEQRDFSAFVNNADFLRDLDAAVAQFDAYMASEDTWYNRKGDPDKALQKGPIAYFCAEFGLHESFNIYSGGLGILAGDHIKEASDLGLPFMAVGLFYRRGFFKQMVDSTGRQEHFFPTLNPDCLPLRRVVNPSHNQPVVVSVPFPGREVKAEVWLAQVGRCPLLLLDTDLEQNALEDRPITSQLYVSGRDMRLYQEMVLGIGGVRALRNLNITPAAWHLNEGHSSFLLVERIREYVSGGTKLADAVDAIRKNSVFTIHTPVPAGNERFGTDLVSRLAEPVLRDSKVQIADILRLGLGVDQDSNIFDMTAFGLRLSNARNGVSILHGHTADDTWKKITPSIGAVTNGVHMPTWLGGRIKEVFASVGGNFNRETDLKVTPTGLGGRMRWEDALKISPRELWNAHRDQKVALAKFAAQKLYKQHQRHGVGPETLRSFESALNPDALIIGFARRFATYKRASLIFSDEKRLLKLLENKDRPVQIVFAGKAHPADRDGQKLIAKIYQQTQNPRFKGKVFFIEEYDMEVGRHLVQGVDIWLNNPRRPLEASGTSGMKAAANGVPNVSILDGWWDEAYDSAHPNGWAIGGRKTAALDAVQDRNDAKDLYYVLENGVIPLFFNRNTEGLPEGWIKVMQNSIASCSFDFATTRMLEDYMRTSYIPAARS